MKKGLYYTLIICLVLTCFPIQAFGADSSPLVPAFPGAEGGGKYVTGGRGKPVYEVTTLADYGKDETAIPGSFRDAVSAGDRTIVFRVGGTIHLKESLKVMGSNLTIAGQTAPGDGITISDYTTSLEADNIIIRYIRFRLGDRYASEDDAFGSRYHKNIIIDHCSFSWSVDEVVSLYDNVNTTVQWSISSESMLMTSHQKGRHGYGGIWGGNNATYHHNLIAHSTSRNPRFPTDKRELDITEMTNNVIYNWGFASSYGGGEGSYNVMNNYYKYGSNTYDIVRSQLFGEVGSAYTTKMYIGGNIMDGNAAVTANNWQGVQKVLDPAAKLNEPIVVKGNYPDLGDNEYNPYAAVSAQDAYDQVLADAGATLPRRDAIDARVINDVRNRTGQHINSPKEVGGYAEYPLTVSDVIDNDHDGMDDGWESANGLSAADAEDHRLQSLSAAGYTNLEVYLNSLIPAIPGDNVDNPNTKITSPTNNLIIETGNSMTISADASDKDGIAKVEFFIDGMKVSEDDTAPYSYDWNAIVDGTHYVTARAVDGQGMATQSNSVTVHANRTTDTGEWESVDIGTVGIPGHAQLEADDSITVKSTGDIGGTADAFHYFYQTLNGNGEIIARVDHITPTDDNAEAGVMIRESLDPNSRMVFMGIPYVKNGKKGVLISRTSTGEESSRIESELFIATPYWIRLVRLGNQLTGLISQDGGSNWLRIGSATLDLPNASPVYAGLAVDASKAENDVWKYNTSNFSGVEIRELAADFPAAPIELAAAIDSGDNEVVLTWSAADGNASSYNVKRGDVAGGPYKDIATNLTSGTTYTDVNVVPGKTYYYVVTAVNASGVQSYESTEVSAIPTGEPENIYYVNDDFEEDAVGTLPAAYFPSFPGNGGVEKVEVAVVPDKTKGNPSEHALYIADQGSSIENAQSVAFFRQFESQKGKVIIEADFMLTEESGNAVLFQVKSYDDSKRAFSVGIRKPTRPDDANKTSNTVVYDNGSSSFYALMDENFSAYRDKWHNIKLVMDVAAGQVTFYMNGIEIGTFDDYKDKDNFKKMGIGRIYSSTAGGGTGTYYLDNVKVYVEPIASPKGLNALPGNEAVGLNWSETPGALSYHVYRSTTNGGPYTLVTPTSEQPNPVPIPATTFVDTSVVNGTAYYYVVTANSDIGESGYSNQAQATPSESAAVPQAPAGLKAVARNAQLELSWDAVANAISYELKRSSDAAGPFVTVASKIEGTSYRLGNVPNEQAYYYVVSAKSVGGSGPDSAPLLATAYAPPGVPSVSLQEGAGQIYLSWTPVEADSYTVKRSATADGVYTAIAESVTTATYGDLQVNEGTPYYYKIAAVKQGMQSPDSSVVAGRTAVSAGEPDVPSRLQAEADDTQIHLSWKAADRAVDYEIVRSMSENGPFTPVASHVTGTEYTDTGLQNGGVYYYAVAARNEVARGYTSELVRTIPAVVLKVAADGSEAFTKVQDAIDAVPDNSVDPTIIRIKDGVYREKVYVSASKKQVSMIGESREGTIITNGDTASTIGPDGKVLGTSNSYTLRAAGTDFTMENITIANSAGINDGQAVALYAEGDRGIYRNVKVTGFQDTLLADKGRQYFTDSYIAGSVDFIFGNSSAVFKNSTVHSAGPGYVTAASTTSGKPGYVFIDSILTAEPGLTGLVDLGRPWRPDSNVIFINSTMGDHIKPAGWNNWGNSANELTARYGEYNSSGVGANAEQRVNWSKQLTTEEASQYTVANILGGTDGWNPEVDKILLDSNSSLKLLHVNGASVAGFAPNVRNYVIKLPVDTTAVPIVTAESFSEAASLEIEQAIEVQGTASVKVIALDGSITQYRMQFVRGSTEETGATDIVVDYPALNLEAGQSRQVHARIIPEQADQTVIWSGSDSIIDVSIDGMISGLRPGRAKATVTSATYLNFITEVDVLVVDHTAPVWGGGGLQASEVTQNSVNLSWPAAADYVGVTHFVILNNGSKIAEVNGNTLSHTVTELRKGTNYEFKIIAYDELLNESIALRANVSTKGESDTSPPYNPGNSGGNGQNDKLINALKEALKDKVKNILLDVGGKLESLIKVELPASLLTAADSDATVTVQTNIASYEIPVRLVRTMLTADDQDATIVVTINQADENLIQKAEEQIKLLEVKLQMEAKLVVEPVQFNIRVNSKGKSQQLSKDSVYTKHTITLPQGVNPDKATGVIVDPITGGIRFVPTVFVEDNGLTKAVIMHAGQGIYAVIESTKSFSDTVQHWAKEDIDRLASKLLIQGNEDGTFEPNRSISRAEFAALLVRSLGLEEMPNHDTFKDVASDDWYMGAIATAEAAGLVQGSGDGLFHPNDSISREEMVVMIARVAQYVGKETRGDSSSDSRFEDFTTVSDWAKDSVQWAVEAGIVNGMQEHVFAPDKPATRAQTVVILNRLLQNLGFINE